jgi:prepilin-type N-terminal cleavage/methylation domain-containing protein
VVKKTFLFKKRAFTLIELIFAIVIIAISVISLPMMIQSSSKASNEGIVQEAIFAAEAILNESTTYYWDLKSQDDANTSSDGYSRVVNTGDCLGGGIPFKRIGHIHRQCLNDNTTLPLNAASSISVENAASEYTNTDILQGSSVNGSAATYKNPYKATVTVNNCSIAPCVQFGLEANNPNLKQIQIQVIDSNTNKTLVLLRAYTANIGEVKPESRIY